ncbi:hypothetical protein T11_18587 [Trichinella zimbabwensis]|uniref:Uncharacterized protein n=1 Tax=Trichinella zimbabwensis TaxID=268475 RepID=A0A0V1HIG9_9BILA|nr:hypothetical protein T11_18587 [Trichinella zimbabwensis]
MTTSYGSNWILRKQHTVDEIPTVSASCRPYHVSDLNQYCNDDRQVQINRLNDRIVGRYQKRDALQQQQQQQQQQHDQHPPLKSTSPRCLKIPSTITTTTTTASFRQKANQLVDDSFTYLDAELNRSLDHQQSGNSACVHRQNGRHGRADADVVVDSCCPTCASSPYSVPYDQEQTPLNHNNNTLQSANIQPDQHGTSSIDEYSEQNFPRPRRANQQAACGGSSAKLNCQFNGQQYAFGQQAQYKQIRNAANYKIWLDDANVSSNPINPIATDAISLNDIPSTQANTAYQSTTDWKMRDRRLCIAILLTALILLVACAGFALALYYD